MVGHADVVPVCEHLRADSEGRIGGVQDDAGQIDARDDRIDARNATLGGTGQPVLEVDAGIRHFDHDIAVAECIR